MTYAGTTHAPTTRETLSDLVRGCLDEDVGLVVTGASAAPAALPGDEGRAVLSLSCLNEVVAHEVEDLTITCEAGCTLSALDALLAPHDQRIAFETSAPEVTTVGGALAGARDGFLRAAYGPVRDQVLGMTVVLGTGERVVSGGRVVKNVTGYDMAKLHVGAGGTLGVIEEVTLRVRPRLPSATCGRRFATPAEAFEAALRARETDGRLSGLAVLGGRAAGPDGGWLVLLRIEGSADARAESFAKLGSPEECEPLAIEDADPAWSAATEFPSSQGFWTRLQMRPSRLAEAARRLTRAAETDRFGLVADVASGALDFTLPRTVRDVGTTVGQLILSRLVHDVEGRVSVPSDPRDLAERFARFGAPPAATRRVLDRLRATFDPKGIMSQGRLMVGFV